MSGNPVNTKSNAGDGRWVRVIGAGFSGLTTAHYLTQAGYRVEIFDSRSQVGGMIQTQRLAHGRVESAANGLLNSPLVEDLFFELNLPLQGTMTHARKRYIFRDGQPHRWSLKFFETLGFVIRLPFLFFFRKRMGPRPYETIAHFGRRLVGLQASQFTVETFLQGIYAGDPQRMSASQILQRFFVGQIPKRKNSNGPLRQTAAIRGTVAPKGGMYELMASLESSLRARGAKFNLDREVSAFEIQEWAREMPVIIAGSAVQASELLQSRPDPRARALQQVEMLPMITATIFFENGLGIEGFGCLFPPSESHQALGVLLNSFIFEGATNGAYSETWMLGGALFDSPYGKDVSQISDEQVLELVRAARKKSFHASSAIVGSEITRWSKALPHYTVELERVMPELQGVQQNILLMGNYLGQIGLAKILERASLAPEEISEKGHWHGK